MRRTFIALAAAGGLIGLCSIGASAAPIAPHIVPPQASAIHQADWYCGPRCHYWHHRRWEARRYWWWRHHDYPYYGYRYGYYYR